MHKICKYAHWEDNRCTLPYRVFKYIVSWTEHAYYGQRSVIIDFGAACITHNTVECCLFFIEILWNWACHNASSRIVCSIGVNTSIIWLKRNISLDNAKRVDHYEEYI